MPDDQPNDTPEKALEANYRGSARSLGYDLANGAIQAVAILVLIAVVLQLTLNLGRNALGLGVDDSDRDAYHRSGLTVHTDARTGVQYVSTPDGGLHVRVAPDGKPLLAPLLAPQ